MVRNGGSRKLKLPSIPGFSARQFVIPFLFCFPDFLRYFLLDMPWIRITLQVSNLFSFDSRLHLTFMAIWWLIQLQVLLEGLVSCLEVGLHLIPYCVYPHYTNNGCVQKFPRNLTILAVASCLTVVVLIDFFAANCYGNNTLCFTCLPFCFFCNMCKPNYSWHAWSMF